MVAQSTTSSARREMSTAVIAATNANSATKSRDGGAVDRVLDRPVEAEVGGDGLGVEAERGARRARPEPYGETAVRASQSRSRSTSRSSAHAWASRWCDSSTGWACWRWVRPGIATPRWRRRLVDEGVDDVEHEPGDDAGVLAQVHPEQRGDLVVARAAGAQAAADVGAGPLDEAALERGVDVLVVLRRGGRRPTRRRRAAARGRRASRRGWRRRAARRRAGPGRGRGSPARSCRRQPPVEVGRLRQGRERVGRSAGEAPAPQGGARASGRASRSGRSRGVPPGVGHEAVDDLAAARGAVGHDHDRVVAGDRAEHPLEAGVVERRGEEVRGPRRGPQDDQVGGVLGRDEQLAGSATGAG